MNSEIMNLTKRVKELENIVAVQRQQIAELQPTKTTYHKMILDCKKPLPLSVIAEDYGIDEDTLVDYVTLAGKRFPITAFEPYMTQKGRLIIYDIMKEKGILPIIER